MSCLSNSVREGLEHCITSPVGTERNPLIVGDEIFLSRSMTGKRDSLGRTQYWTSYCFCSYYYCCFFSSSSSLCACSGGFCFSYYCSYYTSLFGWSYRGSSLHHCSALAESWCDDHECSKNATSFFSFTDSPFSCLPLQLL